MEHNGFGDLIVSNCPLEAIFEIVKAQTTDPMIGVGGRVALMQGPRKQFLFCEGSPAELAVIVVPRGAILLIAAPSECDASQVPFPTL